MIVSERVDLSPPVIDWIQQQLGETVREGRLLPGATTADVIAFTADGFGYVLLLHQREVDLFGVVGHHAGG